MTLSTDSLKVPKSQNKRKFGIRIAGKLALLLFLTFLFIKFSSSKTEPNLFPKEIYLALDSAYSDAVYQQTIGLSAIDDLASLTILHDQFAYDKNFIYIYDHLKIPYQSPKERKKIERLFLERSIGNNPYYEALFPEWNIDDVQLLTSIYNTRKNEYQVFVKVGDTIYKNGAVLNVDGPTFKPLTRRFAKDKNNIYLYGMPIPVDYHSFEVLSPILARDKNGIYHLDTPILHGQPHELGIDTRTIKPLNSFYYKDQQNVYIWNDTEFVIIEGASPQSFKVIKDFYAKDDKAIYYHTHAIENADVKSFNVISPPYSYDKTDTYFKGFPINFHPDPKTLTPLSLEIAKDKDHVYVQYNREFQADTASFRGISITRPLINKDQFSTFSDILIDELTARILVASSQLEESSRYYQDKNMLYYYDIDHLKTIDLQDKAVRVLGYKLATDGDKLYYELEAIAHHDANLLTLNPISRYYLDDGEQIFFYERNLNLKDDSLRLVPLIGINRDNFKYHAFFGEDIAVDDVRVYYRGNIVPNIDAKSFTITSLDYDNKTARNIYYSKDKNHCYKNDQRLPCYEMPK